MLRTEDIYIGARIRLLTGDYAGIRTKEVTTIKRVLIDPDTGYVAFYVTRKGAQWPCSPSCWEPEFKDTQLSNVETEDILNEKETFDLAASAITYLKSGDKDAEDKEI